MLSFENIDYIIRIKKDFPSVYRITSNTHKIDFYIRIKTHLKDIVYNLENYRAAMSSITQELENKTAKIELERLVRNTEKKKH